MAYCALVFFFFFSCCIVFYPMYIPPYDVPFIYQLIHFPFDPELIFCSSMRGLLIGCVCLQPCARGCVVMRMVRFCPLYEDNKAGLN